jgi:hypothetical protein
MQVPVLLPFATLMPGLFLTRPADEPGLRALAAVTLPVNHTRVADLHPQESVAGHVQSA